MTSTDLRTFHLMSARNRLGFGRAEMALVLGLSPTEIAEAEEARRNDLSVLASELPPRVNAKLHSFLTCHPLGIGLFGTATSIEADAGTERSAA